MREKILLYSPVDYPEYFSIASDNDQAGYYKTYHEKEGFRCMTSAIPYDRTSF